MRFTRRSCTPGGGRLGRHVERRDRRCCDAPARDELAQENEEDAVLSAELGPLDGRSIGPELGAERGVLFEELSAPEGQVAEQVDEEAGKGSCSAPVREWRHAGAAATRSEM